VRLRAAALLLGAPPEERGDERRNVTVTIRGDGQAVVDGAEPAELSEVPSDSAD
jgi:hypothetical protein